MLVKLGGMVLLIGLLGCGGIKLESSWRQQKITIDGRDGEWKEKYFFDKEGARGSLLDPRSFCCHAYVICFSGA